MIVAGVGCRRGADADSIDAVLIEALSAFNIEASDLSLIVTETSKGGEPGIRVCAERRGVQLALVPVSDLVRVASRVITRSERVETAKGVPSIAEAAALAVAGPGGRLLGARVANGVATCAIAVGDDP